MSEAKFADNEVFTSKDGREIRLATIKAQVGHQLTARRRNALKNLSPEKKSEFYFKVYEALLRNQMESQSDPQFRMGLSSFTFMREPLNISGFPTTFGHLFETIHLALEDVASTMDLSEK